MREPLPRRVVRGVGHRLLHLGRVLRDLWVDRAYDPARARVLHPVRDRLGLPRAGVRRLLSLVRPRGVVALLRSVHGIAAEIARRRQEERLTIAVDVNPLWENLTGVGWYLYLLLSEMADREDVRFRLYGPDLVAGDDAPPVVPPPRGAAIEHVRYEIDGHSIIPAGWVRRWLHWLQPFLVAADGNRIVWGPNFFLPTRFLVARGAVVVTIHDLGLRRVPWTLQRETRENLERQLERTLRRADRVVTPSEAVRRELIDLEGVEPWRVTAIHHGPGHFSELEPGDPPAGTPERFALHVGTIEPRKNLQTALEAWKILHRRGLDDMTLVLSGKLGWKTSGIEPLLEEGKREGWLHHFGYLPAEELAALFRCADLVVLPSLYEGFGLPVVEALWAGRPLVASDIPVLREVAADAALYAPPDDPEAWADRLEALVRDPELLRDLTARARERVRVFAWSRSADEHVGAWRKTLGSRPRDPSGAT